MASSSVLGLLGSAYDSDEDEKQVAVVAESAASSSHPDDDHSSDSDNAELPVPIPLPSDQAMKMRRLDSAPDVQIAGGAPVMTPEGMLASTYYYESGKKSLEVNPRYDVLFAPDAGPSSASSLTSNPHFRAEFNNIPSGYAERYALSDAVFSQQYQTFESKRVALDPSAPDRMIESSNPLPSYQIGPKTAERKRKTFGDAADVEGFRGPWAAFSGVSTVALNPLAAEAAAAAAASGEAKKFVDSSVLHLKSVHDSLGRSFLDGPPELAHQKTYLKKKALMREASASDASLEDEDVRERSILAVQQCFAPKRVIHTYTGHTKGVTAVRFFPQTAHLLLSASMDCKVKIWEVNNQRRVCRTYAGHEKAVRDICFNNDGRRFISASYDKKLKMWDTETGQVVATFTNGKIPFCVKINPDADKQDQFLVGASDKKIHQWDARSGEIVQTYDEHMDAVNQIVFIDDNRRFISSSDDKSMRIWEYGIPVTVRLIADPTMHSMPSLEIHPSGKYLACQSLDNQIPIYYCKDRVRRLHKKTFKGHMSAGYACQLGFSPDGQYISSGDGDGNLWVWNWGNCQVQTRLKIHDKVLISHAWHPHETSRVATGSWDGTVKLLD